MADSEVWRGFRREFDELAKRQADLIRDRPGSDLTLRAYCSYGDEHPAFGAIRISGSATPRLRTEFEDIATRAGVACGCPATLRPAEFWVHCLCQDLIKSDSNELFGRSVAGGIIQGLIESSASFCLRLATAADEEAHKAAALNRDIAWTAAVDELSLTDGQRREISDAEDQLAASLRAHECTRDFPGQDGWVRVSPPGPHEPTMTEDFRTLERDLSEYAARVIGVIARAAWKIGSVQQFSEYLKGCAQTIRERVVAKIAPRDVFRLNGSGLEAGLDREVELWISKAAKEFSPVRIVTPAADPTGVKNERNPGKAIDATRLGAHLVLTFEDFPLKGYASEFLAKTIADAEKKLVDSAPKGIIEYYAREALSRAQYEEHKQQRVREREENVVQYFQAVFLGYLTAHLDSRRDYRGMRAVLPQVYLELLDQIFFQNWLTDRFGDRDSEQVRFKDEVERALSHSSEWLKFLGVLNQLAQKGGSSEVPGNLPFTELVNPKPSEIPIGGAVASDLTTPWVDLGSEFERYVAEYDSLAADLDPLRPGKWALIRAASPRGERIFKTTAARAAAKANLLQPGDKTEPWQLWLGFLWSKGWRHPEKPRPTGNPLRRRSNSWGSIKIAAESAARTLTQVFQTSADCCRDLAEREGESAAVTPLPVDGEPNGEEGQTRPDAYVTRHWRPEIMDVASLRPPAKEVRSENPKEGFVIERAEEVTGKDAPESEPRWPDPALDVVSETGRSKALAAYVGHWKCSEASLARTAKVDTGDLSRWKKGDLPSGSDKKARIETALRNNAPATPVSKRPAD